MNATNETGHTLRAALALALGPTVALGFARFAYALLLPAMRSDLQWSYGAAGALNTANAAGYLLGALGTPFLVRALGLRRTFVVSMLLTGLALVLTGLTTVYELQLLWRGLAGVTGAFTFVTGGALVARLGRSARESATALTVYYSGSGLGIALSGVLLPALLARLGPTSWPLGWQLLGTAALGATALAALSVPGAAADAPAQEAPLPSGQLALLLPALIAYLLFAAGYIAYMTFVVAFLRSGGASAAEVALVWAALGGAVILGPLVWRAPLARWPGGLPMAALLVTLALGAALPLASRQPGALLLSALLFGSAMMNIPAASTALVRQFLPRSRWNAGIVLATAVFALGQSLGPLVSGALSDRYGLASSLWWSAGTVLLGAVFALLQPRAPLR